MPAIHPHYLERLQPVLDHIRAALDEPLRLEALADKANFSSFHFHRLFKAAMGETVNAHVRRLRMEHAHLLLTTSAHRRIIDVAIACGYASQSTFNRDFKRHFSVTPGQVRRGRSVKRKPLVRSDRSREHAALPVSVNTLPAVPVISRTRFGPYDFRIGLEWIKVIVTAKRQGVLESDSRKIGLIYDDPDITPPDKCRFDATVSTGQAEDCRWLPMGQYAMVGYRGSFGRLGETIDHLYSDWLVSSHYYPADGPLMMLFDGRLHDYSSFRLCLPVSSFR